MNKNSFLLQINTKAQLLSVLFSNFLNYVPTIEILVSYIINPTKNCLTHEQKSVLVHEKDDYDNRMRM